MGFRTKSTITITEGGTPSSYAVAATAASLNGGTTPNSAELTMTNAVIEALTNRRFGVTDTAVEIFDVDDQDNRFGILQLSKRPVISFTSLIDDQRDDPTTLTDGTDYIVYKEYGEVRLIKERPEGELIKGGGVWTIGEQTVKATYTFGYASVPQDVKDAATWYAAFLSEVNASNAGLKSGDAILKSVTIGNYKEAYDTENKLLQNKYKMTFDMLFSILRQKYWITSD